MKYQEVVELKPYFSELVNDIYKYNEEVSICVAVFVLNIVYKVKW